MLRSYPRLRAAMLALVVAVAGVTPTLSVAHADGEMCTVVVIAICQ
jgi:hypothetical protein